MTKTAIIALDCAYGSTDDLEAFARTVYAGTVPTARSGVQCPSIPALVHRLVGNVTGVVARHARIGVVALGGESPSVVARNLAADLARGQGGGPASGILHPNLARALDVGGGWLRQGVADLVVVVGEEDLGVGALLLARAPEVRQDQIVAVVESCVWGALDAGADVYRRGLSEAGVAAAQIGYLDTGVWPPSAAIVASYRTASTGLTCALGCTSTLVGGASPMAALIAAVLSLHRRVIVPMPNPTLPDPGADWHDTPFYVVSESRPWFADSGDGRRIAAAVHTDGITTGHIVLGEVAAHREARPVVRRVADEPRYLLPVPGEDKASILLHLGELRHRIEAAEVLLPVAREVYRDYDASRHAPYTLALVGRTAEELLKEIDFAVEGVTGAFDKGRDWHTPGGSVFTASPLGERGVTFVYPGAFNSYVGLGKDLFQHFPALHERLSTLVSDLGTAVAGRRLYPRSRTRLSNEDLQTKIAELTADPPALIESGAIFAVAHTTIIRDIFGVQPQAALGYSLGEASMLWAAGVWCNGDDGGAALRNSELFRTRIAGPKAAVREHWGLGPDDDLVWTSHLLKARVGDVRRELKQEPQVYLTLVNQPDEVVIAGSEAGCLRVVEALGCHTLPIPFGVVIHSEVIRSEYEAFVSLYTHPIVDQPDVRFYSAADYEPLTLDSDAVADAMARMTCQVVDFPRLVERAYADGARLFVELGPLGTCTRRIKRILRGKPHDAVAINPSPGGDFDGVVGVLAHLLAHRVPVDIAPLYADQTAAPLELLSVPAALAEPAEEGALPEPTLVAAMAGGGATTPWVGTSATPHRATQLRGAPNPSAGDAEPTEVPLPQRENGVVDVYGLIVLPHHRRVAQAHEAFLASRREAQVRAGSVIGLQLSASRQVLGGGDREQSGAEVIAAVVHEGSRNDPQQERVSPGRRWRAGPAATGAGAQVAAGGGETPLFDEADLRDFAAGDVEDCFGPDFAAYRGRRLPRIPNGDLLMMSRIVEIQGRPGVLTGDLSLSSEFDVMDDAWFYSSDVYPGLPPYVALMEMGLQPCGFLSAYLQSSLVEPDADLYFRNLDGRGKLLADVDLRGKTVRDEVRMTSSVRGPGAIIQSFTFGLSSGGLRFYEGEATFGYFRRDRLSRQVGLDGGSEVRSWLEQERGGRMVHIPPRTGSAARKLELLDDLAVIPDGGRYGKGYLRGRGCVSPKDWFFQAHFHQDPVMPGSLGVEAAAQAMVAYAHRQALGFDRRGVRHLVGRPMVWRYRGQITPEDRDWSVDVHVSEVDVASDGVSVVGDASIWKAGLRIYEIIGLAVKLAPVGQNGR